MASESVMSRSQELRALFFPPHLNTSSGPVRPSSIPIRAFAILKVEAGTNSFVLLEGSLPNERYDAPS